MRKVAVFRIRCITGVILLISVIVMIRLYILQIENTEAYTEKANQQYIHTVQNIYNRGNIFFTTKNNETISAASIRSGYVLAINPQRITDPKQVFVSLERFLDIDFEIFEHRATLPNRTYVEIANRITSDIAEEIKALDLSGVMLYRNQWRFYPGDDLASQTIGFVGHDSATGTYIKGLYGLERMYDHVLTRKTEALAVNLFAEIFGHVTNIATGSNRDDDRGHIITTLEPSVSRILDTTLANTHEKYGSSYTGGIIMNPNTGAVIAMSNIPTYNNNDRRGVEVQKFKNPLVENVYEFGSIMKPVTIAIGIDADGIGPNKKFYDRGSITLDQATIRNFDGRARGEVTMQEVLNQSLNTGVSYIVDTIGTNTFREYLVTLGLTDPSGIDLPNDVRGITSNLNSPRRIEYATASFGQGIAVSPMVMVKVLSALGNGGKVVTPHIVSSIEYGNGDIVDMTPDILHEAFTSETSELISRMLTDTVDTALRGGKYSLENHTIAAKTGTAQIPNPQTGGYYDDRFLHSFFGYFPAYQPEFIILLYTVDPKGVDYASETLTKPFMKMTNFLLNYYEIPPDR